MNMKGWYCIYECSEGKWLMDNQWWSKDLSLHSEYLPTRWEAHIETIHNGYGENEPKTFVRMVGNDWKDIAILDKNHKTNPYSILKFETMNEAEYHLLTKSFDVNNGKYYSIRKIYF